MEKRKSLLTHVTLIFLMLAIITIVFSGVITYYAQMRSYREMCWDEIKAVSDYLTLLIQNDSDDFREYTEYYKEHFKEMRIPLDFDDYSTSEAAFARAFAKEYPGKIFKEDIPASEMTDELKLLYYTYRQEYWLLTFESARESFDLPYTYFLTLKEDVHNVVYQIDGERTEDKEHPGFLYMGDEYFNDPETYEILWRTWETGEKQKEVYEWNNEWGNTYSYYTPLVIDGEKLGLVVAEIDVARVNRGILFNSLRLGVRLAAIFAVGLILTLIAINKGYISKLLFLADKISAYGNTRDPHTADELSDYDFGGTEIGMLADETSAMIREIEAHEMEVERSARMKADFLANMSHEIRTPLNAIIGMAEMVLRGDVSIATRTRMEQIISSGHALLNAINDILDLSMAESGNLIIEDTAYEPISVFRDVANIIPLKLDQKPVQLDFNIPASLPSRLYGDSMRIKQIILNLASNAVKFTDEGYIDINVSYEPLSDDEIMLNIGISDSGIGIRKEDINTIFESFSQLDSGRNRTSEGIGLGLSIAQRLADLMGGKLEVVSEYGSGSTFTFSVQQRVADWNSQLKVKEPDKCIGISFFSDNRQAALFKRDSERLQIKTYTIASDEDIVTALAEIKQNSLSDTYFIFTDSGRLDQDLASYLEKEPDTVVVMVTDFNDSRDLDMSNLIRVRKPLSVVNMSKVYNRDSQYFENAHTEDEREFTAPDAYILVVDDNAVNLAVAKGILGPLNMNIETASGGRKAVEMAGNRRYDLILMDHMMPEVDGIEATHLIREKYPEYKNIPIIAFTANTDPDARREFKEAGLDDFIGKPIEVKKLISMIRQWLPDEKIVINKEEAGDVISEASSGKGPVIGDLDTSAAIAMIGSEEVFKKILSEYYSVIEANADVIRDVYEKEDWKDFIIEMHALKGSSRQIGASELSDMAESLERAGKDMDIDFIREHTDEMLKKYISYKTVLDSLFADRLRKQAAKI